MTLATVSIVEYLTLKAERDLLLVACKAYEREYDEENTSTDPSCPDCTLGCIPILSPRLCAHHLRVNAIKRAES